MPKLTRLADWRVGVGAALVLFCHFQADVPAQEPTRRASVLMVFSGGSGTPFLFDTQKAFERALVQRLGRDVQFNPVYLGLTTENDEAFEQAAATLVAQRFPADTIDLVLVERFEALAFLLRHRAPLLPRVPIVFTEVFQDELAAADLPSDATGVVSVRPMGTLPIALALIPGTRRLVVVAGGTPADRRFAAAVRQHAVATWPALEIEMLDGQPLAAQLSRVAQLPPHSLILFTTHFGDESGQLTSATQVLEDLARAASAPIFGFQRYYLGHGIVGGALLQPDVIAGRAADLAARIIRGEAASTLPYVTEPATAVSFDARQLERWGISERRLPEGSTVLFREPTLWSEHRWSIAGVSALVLAQGLLIAGLFLERRKRQRAQVSLADAEQRYRTVADFAADWEYWTLADGSVRYMSPSCEAITGHGAAAFIDRPGLLSDIVADEDRDGWLEHQARAESMPGPVSTEFRIRTLDGRTRWIEHVCSAATGPDGTDLGRRASNRDVTPRKQAEDDLRRALREIQELRDRLEIDNTYLREQLQPESGIEGILGTSDAMRYVTSRVQQVAPTGSTVLLLGETGVGKSLLAQAIHDLSPRRARPLITLNCATLTPTLVESELFGHEKGAFTGAQARRVGRFEIASGGTLFLDEITELPLDLQGKLLRALQEGEFERVGSSATLKTDVRVIAATNRKLDEEVRAGRFRQDLLYRLNVFPITVAPLRQRPDDVPLLVGHFLRKHARRLGVPVPEVSKATMKGLQAREWPGNIRELENVLERALITSRGARFEIHDERGPAAGASPGGPVPSSASRSLAEIERDHILATLERLQWRIEGDGGAADVLGINASTLRSRMRKHGIRRPGR